MSFFSQPFNQNSVPFRVQECLSQDTECPPCHRFLSTSPSPGRNISFHWERKCVSGTPRFSSLPPGGSSLRRAFPPECRGRQHSWARGHDKQCHLVLWEEATFNAPQLQGLNWALAWQSHQSGLFCTICFSTSYSQSRFWFYTLKGWRISLLCVVHTITMSSLSKTRLAREVT